MFSHVFNTMLTFTTFFSIIFTFITVIINPVIFIFLSSRWDVFRWPHKMATEVAKQEKNMRSLEVRS